MCVYGMLLALAIQLGILLHRMLQRKVFINKIRMLQRTQDGITNAGEYYRPTSTLITASSSLLSFVRFSYQLTCTVYKS
jgi:hypothetical protein